MSGKKSLPSRSVLAESAVDGAIASTSNTGFTETSSELNDARDALSLPIQKTRVAVKSAAGALEAVVKELGYGNSIERALRKLDCPETLKGVIRANWVYASDRARHISESKPPPSYDDALFCLHTVSATIMRLLGSMHCSCCGVSSISARIRDDACEKCSSPKHGCSQCSRCVEFVEERVHDDPRDGVIYRETWCQSCVDQRLADLEAEEYYASEEYAEWHARRMDEYLQLEDEYYNQNQRRA